MSADDQRIKWHRNIAENFNRLSRVHERYRQTDRQQTDGRLIANGNVSSHLLQSRSRDPITAPFDLICIFSLGPPVANRCAKFEVSSNNRSRDMEGVPKF